KSLADTTADTRYNDSDVRWTFFGSYVRRRRSYRLSGRSGASVVNYEWFYCFQNSGGGREIFGIASDYATQVGGSI
ncbi:MAG: hypothetical protein M3Y84_03565, partial [Acidobacteriota bacterium]|nr:hypothetical protein [Acidobacteriota bacterium]